MVMAPAGWAIERAMAAVPLSRNTDRRAITPERLSQGLGGSQPLLLPAREYVTRMSPPLALRPVATLHPIIRIKKVDGGNQRII